MTKRTTMNRLLRWVQMMEAEKAGRPWVVNEYGHPYPLIPKQKYLSDHYLDEAIKSRPESEIKLVKYLVKYVGKERR